MKTVLDNPDICQGAILTAPSIQVDPNFIGPVKVSSINQSISFILTPHFSNNMNQGCLQAIGKQLNMLIK